MIVVSNNLLGKMPIDDDVIIRINLAWLKDINEAKKLLDDSSHDIYLDYPSGRTKPPTPRMSLHDVLELCQHDNVKYFAVSNMEDPKIVKSIMDQIDVELVPKIETELGVKNIRGMIDVGIKTIMLDKEDLYTNVGCDSERFEKLLVEARANEVNILELQGVVFNG